MSSTIILPMNLSQAFGNAANQHLSCDVRQENGWLVLDGAFPHPRRRARSVFEGLCRPEGQLRIRPSDFELVQEGADAIPFRWTRSSRWATPT